MKIRLLLLCSLLLFDLLGDTLQAQKTVYIPTQLTNEGYSETDTAKTWCKVRSRQNDNIIVFWGKGYGANDPNSAAVPEAYRVDVDDLLSKLNSFYNEYVVTLKFAQLGVGKSNLDKYKVVILLYYTTDWMAFGSGFDNTIGGMWISPSTCKPVGQTIAHECGHSFQYEVYCDLGGNAGFRDGPAGAFWEQCAQWMSYQNYPAQAFSSYDFTCHSERYNLAFSHEWQRYASYFYQYYLTNKYGVDFIGRLWCYDTGSEKLDACGAYMKMMGMNSTDFFKEYFDAAMKMTTFDLDNIREYGKDYLGKWRFDYVDLGDKTFQVDYSSCPQSTGFNVIPLKVPAAGTAISTIFTPLAPGCDLAVGDHGTAKMSESKDTVTHYNTFVGGTLANRGFRHGYVALLKDGSRVYSSTDTVYGRGAAGMVDTTTFVVPQNTERLWFVVSPAPAKYFQHLWDDNITNDDQWPYKVKFEETDILGHLNIDFTRGLCDTVVNYYIGFDASADSYAGTTVTIADDEAAAVGTALQMQPKEIANYIVPWASTLGEGQIMFYPVSSEGLMKNLGSTANGYGHWFNAKGNVCGWGASSYVYSEFNPSNLTFTIGQYPGHCKNGDVYTIREMLRYMKDGKYGRATIAFHIYIGGVPDRVETLQNESGLISVFDISGRLVRTGTTWEEAQKNLSKGLYIVGGKKLWVK